MEDVQTGLRTAIRNLGELPGAVSAMGISGMMHGYLAFDKDWNLLAPFRTWQNTMTGEAAEQLTAEFGFNIPQRWSIAHLYQAVLNGEAHVKNIAHITTLAGYVHYLLTGENVLGVGEASGMFPIDSEALDYDAAMLEKFDALIAKYGFAWTARSVLPKVLTAGQAAGALTQAGSTFLDGLLSAGILFCPPEGRRRHRHDGDERRRTQNRQRLGRYVYLRHGRSGKAAVEGLSGDRHGHHAQRQACRHGTLQ